MRANSRNRSYKSLIFFFFGVELVVIERVGDKYDDIIVIIVRIKSAI
jgi:hypothetical protein